MGERTLTSGEIKLAKTVYKKALKYSKIRIHDESYIFFQPDNSGMTPNGEIYMSGSAYHADYSKEGKHTRAFFIHEMAHVWQYQCNVLSPIWSAIGETIHHLGNYSKAYQYTLDASKDLLDYGIEQQASILEDYYLSIAGGGGSSGSPSGGKPKTKMQAVLKKFLQNPAYPRALARKRAEARRNNKFYCFPGDTEILLPAGPRPIASVQLGDEVLTYDSRRQRIRPVAVRRVDRHRGEFELHRVQMRNGAVMVTSGHLLVDLTTGDWSPAERLADETLLATDSGTQRVIHVDHGVESCNSVFNLRLAESHNYFVTRAGVMARDH
jgi:Hint domain